MVTSLYRALRKQHYRTMAQTANDTCDSCVYQYRESTYRWLFVFTVTGGRERNGPRTVSCDRQLLELSTDPWRSMFFSRVIITREELWGVRARDAPAKGGGGGRLRGFEICDEHRGEPGGRSYMDAGFIGGAAGTDCSSWAEQTGRQCSGV